jgi:hypothetical protein
MGELLSHPAELVPHSIRAVDDRRPALDAIDRAMAGAAAFATVAALSPVLTTSFGFLDDYSLMQTTQISARATWDQYLVGGRPVAGLLAMGFFSYVHTIDQLVVMRIFSVICLALSSMLGFIALRQLAYRRLPAWTFALGLLWLPSTQVMASWAILLVESAAFLLAMLAAKSASDHLERVLRTDARWLERTAGLVPSVLLLSTAVCTDQPAAMAFWPIVCLLLLAPVRRAWTVRKLLAGALVAGVVGALSSAVGYVAVQLGTAWVGTALTRGALVTDIGGKIHYFVWVAAPRVFDPWTLGADRRLALLTAVLLAVLIPVAVGGTLTRRLVGLALVAASLPLSYLASMVTAENWASARSLAGAYVVPLAALTLLLQAIPRPARGATPLIGVAATLVALVAVYSGFRNVSVYFSEPEHEELTLARSEVRPKLVGVTSPVVVVRSDWTDTLAPGVSFDEFGIPSTYASWVPVPFTELLAREATGRWLRNVRLVDRSALRSVPRTTLVIDYGHLLDRADNAVVYHGQGRE